MAYSTPADIRRRERLIKQDVMTDEELQDCIVTADEEMVARLLIVYGSESALTASAPYASYPAPRRENKGTGRLIGVTAGSGAGTEQWEVEFTSNTAFKVMGSVSGSQGAGSVSADFTSTNGFLEIPAAKWVDSDQIQVGDQFLVSTYDKKKLLMVISAWLATSEALNRIFSDQAPNVAAADKWADKANAILDELSDPNEGKYRLDTFPNLDLDPIGVQYDVDEVGRDVGTYADNELD